MCLISGPQAVQLASGPAAALLAFGPAVALLAFGPAVALLAFGKTVVRLGYLLTSPHLSSNELTEIVIEVSRHITPRSAVHNALKVSPLLERGLIAFITCVIALLFISVTVTALHSF